MAPHPPAHLPCRYPVVVLALVVQLVALVALTAHNAHRAVVEGDLVHAAGVDAPEQHSLAAAGYSVAAVVVGLPCLPLLVVLVVSAFPRVRRGAVTAAAVLQVPLASGAALLIVSALRGAVGGGVLASWSLGTAVLVLLAAGGMLLAAATAPTRHRLGPGPGAVPR